MSIVDISYKITRLDVMKEEDIIELFYENGWALAGSEMKLDGTIVMKFWSASDNRSTDKKRKDTNELSLLNSKKLKLNHSSGF